MYSDHTTLRRLESTQNERILRIAQQVVKDRNFKFKFQIVEASDNGLASISNTDMPCAIGLFKHIILLPNCKNYPDEKVYWILLHELYHFKLKSIWFMLFINIFMIFFWWYPPTFKFQRAVTNAVETFCDNMATRNFLEKKKKSYLQCLLEMHQEKMETLPMLTEQDKGSPLGSFLNNPYENKEFLMQRFALVLDTNKVAESKKASVARILILLASIACIGFSYKYLPQTYYENPEEDIIEFNAENSYVKLDNGEYILYYKGDIYARFTNSKYIPEGIPVLD